MKEKQFYDWQTLGGTDDVMRFVNSMGYDPVWSIAKAGNGFLLNVEPVEGVLQRKTRTWRDKTRRQSNRLKDLADIAHLVESNPDLWDHLSNELQSAIERPER